MCVCVYIYIYIYAYAYVVIQVESGSSSWENTVTVQKSKDLLGCTDRQDVQTIFQGSNYDSNSVSINNCLVQKIVVTAMTSTRF